MPDTTDTISEDDIADVDLRTTDLSAPAQAEDTGSTADEGKDDAADTNTEAGSDDSKSDANTTEAKDQTGAKDDAKSDDQATDQQAEGKDAEGNQGQEPTAEELRAEQRARAQQEWQNRQRTRNQVADQLDNNFGPKTADQLEDEGLDPQDAKIEAVRQEFAYNQERTRVAELNAGMQAEAVNAMHDFPVFDPNSKEFDPEFTEKVQQQYQVAARIQTAEVGRDPQGRPIEVITNAEVPLYDFYQQMADIYSRGATKGNQEGQAEMQQMLARTENPGGSSSTNGSQGNTLEEMEERLGDVRIA